MEVTTFTPVKIRRAQTNRYAPATAPQAKPSALKAWVRTQAVNVQRHHEALRPFQRDEFGKDDAAPSYAHIEAVNKMIEALRAEIEKHTRHITHFAHEAIEDTTPRSLQQMVVHKDHAHGWVLAVERVWDFYFELFGQRQTSFSNWLLSCDRIALDCYQVAYMGLGTFKSIPTPPPFSYMRTGFSPATFRRGIRLQRLGHLLNPFPLVQMPYHRLVNPWAMGATLHELSHNLQTDLGLSQIVPRRMAKRLLDAGMSSFIAAVWAKWNRELFADLLGLLLGGPAFVLSLMDVIGRSVRATLHFSPDAPHPTPYLRALINIELLRRMNFPEHAATYRDIWTRIYPDPNVGNLPKALLDTFEQAHQLIVDEVCFQPYLELGNKSLIQMIRFGQKEQQMIEEAAGRLAHGNDPGIIPPRFLIGAARVAFNRKLASPAVIMKNFYKTLDWR